MTDTETFAAWFKRATEHDPYAYQQALILREAAVPKLLRLPTGSGKTEAILGLWLWRWLHAPPGQVPRRLVYVLPMRTLVEQTASVAQRILTRLDYGDQIKVHIIMGGEEGLRRNEWIAEPERPAILVGTQDMLLSRALNRGYAQSRFAWPRSFGLLHNDCYWVLDEIQLMGNGLATSAQLAAFRKQLGTAAPVWVTWMSATASPGWLATVDHAAPAPHEIFELSVHDWQLSADLAEPAQHLAKRLHAPKQLHFSGIRLASSKAADLNTYVESLAAKARQEHQPGSLTLVVLNTVERARQLYRALQPRKGVKSEQPSLHVLLLHSHFRPRDRREKLRELLSAAKKPDAQGVIAVTTQVVEAGVDISARTLVTELAPWSSLIQRFGRLHRNGEFSSASVFWTDLPDEAAPPYDAAELTTSREQLTKLEGRSVSPSTLEQLNILLPYRPEYVLRRRDLLGLFDTTADLTEVDLDVSLYVRDIGDDRDVPVFWRDWETQQATLPEESEEGDGEDAEEESTGDGASDEPRSAAKASAVSSGPSPDEPEPDLEELCPAPIAEVRDLIRKGHAAFRRHPVTARWIRVRESELVPGVPLLFHVSAGHYSSETGWDKSAGQRVVPLSTSHRKHDAIAGDPSSEHQWQSLAEHTDAVVAHLNRITTALHMPNEMATLLQRAARFHDLGKAHPCWQMRLQGANGTSRPLVYEKQLMAKAPVLAKAGRRRYLRHELASALALLAAPQLLDGLPPLEADLIRYLIASHHGKVRMAIRSLLDEQQPYPHDCLPSLASTAPAPRTTTTSLYALGILDGDELPPADLGGDIHTPHITLSLDVINLGDGPQGHSWAQRICILRDAEAIGPFRLAYYEALLRAADIQASSLDSEGKSHA